MTLYVVIIFLISIGGISWYIYSKIKNRSLIIDKIEQNFGIEKVFKKTNIDELHFPAIGFGGDYGEAAIHLVSKDDYKKGFFMKIDLHRKQTNDSSKFDEVIDAEGNIFGLSPLEIGMIDNKEISVEKFKKKGGNKNFSQLKTKVLKSIVAEKKEYDGESLYSGLENEIERSSNITELVNIMGRGFQG